MLNTRILVVDDASLFRRVVTEALSGVPGVEVVGSASNGRLALSRLAELKPDIMTLDIEMPEMSGLDVLEAMRGVPGAPNVIVLSAQTVRGSQLTIRALELGAFDFITKPDGGSPSENLARLRDCLRPLIQALARKREIRSILGASATLSAPAARPVLPVSPVRAHANGRNGQPIVLIGVSTGGPTALAQVIPLFPAKIGAPVFIVQHMPPHFTEALAQRLNSQSALQVTEARNGEVAQPDCVYIAPGGRQMKLAPGASGEITIRITDDPPENSCRPAVDYLFRSAATYFPGRSIAAVLTGMGCDGTEGMRLLKRTGSLNIAQDEASCVVFGMPREAIHAGIVDSVVPLGRIAESILKGLAEMRNATEVRT
jgi:two-component system chemotaxis response regulator CheB